MEGEKNLKLGKKEENKEFVNRIVEFIKTRKPTKTSEFVQAGFFKNRNEARRVLQKLDEQGIVTMEKGKNKRYSYSLPKNERGSKA